jgi:prepilin-type N-terminal cleavage/methylation domain-containing protein
MKRGFTILELLVASLLLGMLVTVLTMIFNQSSIAWRTGVAGLMDMDEVRDNIAAVRDEADSLYPWNDKLHRTVSIWNEESGSTSRLKKRAIDADDSGVDETERLNWLTDYSELEKDAPELNKVYGPVDLSSGKDNSGKNWIINVKSSGPNRKLNDYDDIWSMPYDFD